jgi:predicted transcriptional regulator of viral defense system
MFLNPVENSTGCRNYMNLAEIIKCLQGSRLKIFTFSDLKRLFRIELDNSAYKTAERLVKKGLLSRLRKGLYASFFNTLDDFEIANRLYPPSYISLETALSFYGMLSGFPYLITSVTFRKTKRIETVNKEFEYVHIQKEFFRDYEKQNNFLIALPEKALIDEVYFVSKGWRKIDFHELDYSKLNIIKLKKMANKIKYAPFRNLWKELKL